MPTSPYELARSLRRVRTRQGLRLEDVSARTGLPFHQLQAIETGTFDVATDRVAVLRTLRRYADFLGLPGDRYVLVLVDHWPPPPPVGGASASPATQIVAIHTGPVPTGVVPGPGPSTGPATGVLPARPSPQPVLTGGTAATGMLPVGAVGSQALGIGLHDTGITAAVPSPRSTPYQTGPTSRTPVLLRLLVALVALALVVGVAGLLIHHFEPRWLSSIGITAKSPATASPPGTSTASPPGTSTASPASTPKRSGTTGGSKTKSTGKATMTVDKTSSSSATFVVTAPTFTVKVAVPSSDSWVQVKGPATSPTTSSVLFSGLLTAGQSKSFVVQSKLTVTIGSVAALISVSVGNTLVGSYDSTVAPFAMTFQTATS